MRSLTLAAVLLLAAPAWAANPDWVNVQSTGGTQKCYGVTDGQLCSFQWTASADASSGFLGTRNVAFSLRLEPHKEGSATAATADVYACTAEDANTCTALNWDTDGDGIVDDNTLDASNVMKIGTPVFLGIPFIYIDPTADPVSGTAEVVATGEKR